MQIISGHDQARAALGMSAEGGPGASRPGTPPVAGTAPSGRRRSSWAVPARAAGKWAHRRGCRARREGRAPGCSRQAGVDPADGKRRRAAEVVVR
ncbi:hypothetical protein HBB16_10285 [Pseudonocardia sp. MCCB 268]|nr:hypothetical protein [Pseudonocardia cytotoxica]